MRAAALILVAGAACRAQPPVTARALAAGHCLDLPGTYRGSIQIGAAQDAAYWIEDHWERDGLNQLRRTSHLMRLDLATAAVTTTATEVTAPFRVLPDGTVIARREDRSAFTVYPPAAAPWDLLIGNDDGKVSNLAVDADGARVAVSHNDGTLDLIRLADRHRVRFPTGGWVLFIDGNYVVYSHDDRDLAEIAEGLPTPHSLGTLPDPGWFSTGKSVFYLGDAGAGVWKRGGEMTPVWKGPTTLWGFTEQVVVVADGSPSSGAVFSGDHRWELPRLEGGGQYAGAARLADGRFIALVAHDTRFDDGIDERDERDVCVIAPGATVTLPTRTLPKEYVGLSAEVKAAAAEIGKPTDYVIDRDAGDIASLVVFLDGKGGDPERMLAQITAFEKRMAKVAPDHLRLTLRWRGDHHRASSWWSFRQERRRAAAGLPGAEVERSGDAAIELDSVELTYKPTGGEGRPEITCAGFARNRTERPLALEVSCGGEWYQILPSPLGAGAKGWWRATVALDPGVDERSSRGWSHAFRTAQNDNVIWQDPGADELAAGLLVLADTVGARTKMTPTNWSWDGGDAAISVDVVPPDGFSALTHAERVAAAELTLAAVAPWVRQAVFASPTTPITLEIDNYARHWIYRDGSLEEPDE